MTAKPYQITIDHRRSLIAISFTPVFWSDSVSSSFVADCLAAVQSMTCKPAEHLILVDLQNAVLQSKDVYDRMIGLVGAATARRIALIAAAPLARMQTKRLQIRDNVVMFDDAASAQAWLFAADEAAAAA